MYASSRLRALEKRMIGRERMEALIACRTSEEVLARLSEYGLSLPEDGDPSSGAVRETMLLATLREAYAEVEAAVPDAAPYRAFRYPYDCNNLKVAVKCAVRGIGDLTASDLLFDFGTVPADRVEGAVTDGRGLEAYPPAMAAAVPAARAAFEQTGDSRRIDAVLDRACFADMLATVAALGDKVILTRLREKIDLVNIRICLRLLRMDRGIAGEAFLSDTLIAGGTLDEAFFVKAYAAGEGGLWNALIPTAYTRLSRLGGEGVSLSLVEKTADDLWMDALRADARAPFGPSVAVGYLVGWETAVKNIRIVLSAKDAGLDDSVLRERIRESYV